MDYDNIINQLYSNSKVESLLKRFPASIKEDLKQTSFLFLLEQPKQKVIELEKNGLLISYFCKVILNTFNGRKYKLKHNISNDDIKGIESVFVCEIEVYNEKHINFDLLENENWLAAKILKAYIEIGSIRKTEKKINICAKTIFTNIAIAKQIIKQNGEKYITTTTSPND